MVSFPPSVSYFYSVCFWVMGGCFDGGGSGLNMEVLSLVFLPLSTLPLSFFSSSVFIVSCWVLLMEDGGVGLMKVEMVLCCYSAGVCE
ncbi:unnamed protein product [Trifolium pratense]|uniref:Uncharacterized protein n=1 Tax=Trifolium pratense TaxID=57577 RepID=A0ACB0KX55_TRIPR|nr:unnamed protein product [Trifolium pratense]